MFNFNVTEIQISENGNEFVVLTEALSLLRMVYQLKLMNLNTIKIKIFKCKWKCEVTDNINKYYIQQTI